MYCCWWKCAIFVQLYNLWCMERMYKNSLYQNIRARRQKATNREQTQLIFFSNVRIEKYIVSILFLKHFLRYDSEKKISIKFGTMHRHKCTHELAPILNVLIQLFWLKYWFISSFVFIPNSLRMGIHMLQKL